MGVAILVPNADFRRTNLGQVSPTSSLPIQGLAIMGESSVYLTSRYSVSFIPTFTTQRSVNWAIVSGGSYASINSNGVLTVSPGVSDQSVTIRCTSVSDSSIYAEKSVRVSSTQIVFKDWVTSDGTDAIYHPGLNDRWNATVTLRCTLGGANTYMLCCMYASDSTQARIAAYNNGSNKASAYAGTGGTNNWVTKSNIIYRYVWNLGARNEASGGSAYLYNDATGAVLGSKTSVKITLSGWLGIFRYATGPANSSVPTTATGLTPSGAKFYGLTVVSTVDNSTILDLRPCIYGGIAGVYDTVSQTFWPGIENNGGITAGND